MVGGFSTVVGVACLGIAALAFVVDGSSAFEFDAERWLRLSGPTCALLAAPFFFLAPRLLRQPAGPEETSPPDLDRERLLRHAMRIETVGDLASLVAHQLRNHLQVMMGHAALASAEDQNGQDQRLSTIRNEIGTSIDLLEQLLSLAHPHEGTPTRVDLVELCRTFGASVRQVLPSAIDFDVDLPERAVHALLDPRGLEHSLLNLVINARHATEGRGRLTLALSIHDGRARVEVSDTGTGIPEADIERVFEPYFTTKPKGEGTGLGLAAVQRYVRSASGEVAVDSQVGRGTTFRLEFPLAQ